MPPSPKKNKKQKQKTNPKFVIPAFTPHPITK